MCILDVIGNKKFLAETQSPQKRRQYEIQNCCNGIDSAAVFCQYQECQENAPVVKDNTFVLAMTRPENDYLGK